MNCSMCYWSTVITSLEVDCVSGTNKLGIAQFCCIPSVLFKYLENLKTYKKNISRGV